MAGRGQGPDSDGLRPTGLLRRRDRGAGRGLRGHQPGARRRPRRSEPRPRPAPRPRPTHATRPRPAPRPRPTHATRPRPAPRPRPTHATRPRPAPRPRPTHATRPRPAPRPRPTHATTPRPAPGPRPTHATRPRPGSASWKRRSGGWARVPDGCHPLPRSRGGFGPSSEQRRPASARRDRATPGIVPSGDWPGSSRNVRRAGMPGVRAAPSAPEWTTGSP